MIFDKNHTVHDVIHFFCLSSHPSLNYFELIKNNPRGKKISLYKNKISSDIFYQTIAKSNISYGTVVVLRAILNIK